MVAVLTVFANHLWHWPRGGFIGVDVFFVISGFLITGNLLRDAEATGTVSFRKFYGRRVRRIVPAATVVLVLTYVASLLAFRSFRAHQVGIDALFAFAFMANWRFAFEGTDYFRAAVTSVSPLQHYWSLSIEEQFYFVWPAVVLIVSVVVARKGLTHSRGLRLTGVFMAAVIAASFSWAVRETVTSPNWAYFDTLSRVWELGVGALLATAVGLLARIPRGVKPLLSWAGLGLIAASAFMIGDASPGFPAPWALLPVAGAALVISAGVGGEPEYQTFLRNPISTYVGDISYSLYLVHWPVIVILAAIMEPGAIIQPGISFSVSALAISFGLAIASYHLVENPFRNYRWRRPREDAGGSSDGRYQQEKASHYAVVAVALLVAGLCAASLGFSGTSQLTRGALSAAQTAWARIPLGPSPRQEGVEVGVQSQALPASAVPTRKSLGQSAEPPNAGPLTAALQREIADALEATDWPRLDPSMESVIGGTARQGPEIEDCDGTVRVGPPDALLCTWGSSSAPTRAVLVGDSIAMNYAAPLTELALNSGGQLQLHAEWMPDCRFAEGFDGPVPQMYEAVPCKDRTQHAIDVINSTKPDVVIVSNSYLGDDNLVDGWATSLRQTTEKFRESTKKIVFLSPPPPDKKIGECFGTQSSKPADCIGRVTEQWRSMAEAEQSVAGTWIDSRPWLCSPDGLCPIFVATTPMKQDLVHLTPAYSSKISPVIGESLRQAGIF